MVRDLHNARGVLDYSDLGTLLKFADGVGKTVFGNSSVGIDDENVGSSDEFSSLALLTKTLGDVLTCEYFPLPKHDLPSLSAPKRGLSDTGPARRSRAKSM